MPQRIAAADMDDAIEKLYNLNQIDDLLAVLSQLESELREGQNYFSVINGIDIPLSRRTFASMIRLEFRIRELQNIIDNTEVLTYEEHAHLEREAWEELIVAEWELTQDYYDSYL